MIAPQPDYAQKTMRVMAAFERWEKDPARRQGVSEAITGVFNGGGIMVLLGWAQLLGGVADGEPGELVVGTAGFRRDLAAELVTATGQDAAVQHDVLNRILDLDDQPLFEFTVNLGLAVRQHVFSACGGVRHCLAVLVEVDAAARVSGHTDRDLAPAVVPCGVTLAAASVGSYDTARRSSAVGFARAGYSSMLTLLWLAAQGTARADGAQAIVVDEHGVPARTVGTDPGTDSQQRVHALTLRLLRTPIQEAKTSEVFAEIGTLDWGDKMALVWSMSTAAGSLFASAAPRENR